MAVKKKFPYKAAIVPAMVDAGQSRGKQDAVKVVSAVEPVSMHVNSARFPSMNTEWQKSTNPNALPAKNVPKSVRRRSFIFMNARIISWSNAPIRAKVQRRRNSAKQAVSAAGSARRPVLQVLLK